MRRDAIERAITDLELAEARFRRLREMTSLEYLRPDWVGKAGWEYRRARQKLEGMLVVHGKPYHYRGRVFRIDRGGFLVDTPSERSA